MERRINQRALVIVLAGAFCTTNPGTSREMEVAGTSNGSGAFSSNWKNLQKVLKEEAALSTSIGTSDQSIIGVSSNSAPGDGFTVVSRKRKRRKKVVAETAGGHAERQDGIWKKRKTEVLEATSSVTVSSSSNKPVEMTKALGLDCEYVGTGADGKGNMLARVSIVNSDGECVYDKYVRPMERITDYRTEVSGIRPNNLENGETFQKVQQEVCKLLAGKVVVGHALQNDFKVLNVSHTRKLTRDTAKYMPLKNLVKKKFPSLKLLAKEVLGINIQQGEHDSITDARVAMKLYLFHKKQWERDLRKFSVK